MMSHVRTGPKNAQRHRKPKSLHRMIVYNTVQYSVLVCELEGSCSGLIQLLATEYSYCNDVNSTVLLLEFSEYDTRTY
jgi:hypothetical protein